MSEPVIPAKNEALIEVRKRLKVCPDCGAAFDAVNANSHKTRPDPASVRFYFQFVHGDDECIVHVNAVDFRGWIDGVADA
ncbi:MAG: hypothetical protein H6807_03145 [Planctomycetes bacterium]|nr:hypothetical protein [Planctomycetota bacterium]